jgi:hypothetical protein
MTYNHELQVILYTTQEKLSTTQTKLVQLIQEHVDLVKEHAAAQAEIVELREEKAAAADAAAAAASAAAADTGDLNEELETALDCLEVADTAIVSLLGEASVAAADYAESCDEVAVVRDWIAADKAVAKERANKVEARAAEAHQGVLDTVCWQMRRTGAADAQAATQYEEGVALVQSGMALMESAGTARQATSKDVEEKILVGLRRYLSPRRPACLMPPHHLSRPDWPRRHLSRPHWPPRHLSPPR